MKELYKRFDVNISLSRALEIFDNKIQNLLKNADIFVNRDFEVIVHCDLNYQLCNELGDRYLSFDLLQDRLTSVSRNFNEYLARLQAILSKLHEAGHNEQYNALVFVINTAIEESPVDLGIRLKLYKRKCASIVFAGSKLLDKKLVDDVIGILDDDSKLPIKIAFEKGLTEYMQAKQDKRKLKNSVRDMQVACDETVKLIFQDKNLGLKHFFKDDRYKLIKFNEYQKKIYWQLNDYIDKLVKHKADGEINNEDAENIIYLTGMFIRMAVLKSENEKPAKKVKTVKRK